jgi:hypothetical protein
MLEHLMPGGVCWWHGVSSTASATTGLGGMVQYGLDDSRLMMHASRTVALSGTVVTSTEADLAAATSQACAMMRIESLLDWFVLLARCWEVW